MNLATLVSVGTDERISIIRHPFLFKVSSSVRLLSRPRPRAPGVVGGVDYARYILSFFLSSHFRRFFFLKFFFFFRNSFCLFFLYSLRVVHKRLITRTQSLFPAPPPSSRAPSESLKSWLCLLVSFFCFVFRIPKKKKKSRRTHTHIQEEKKNRYQKARNTLVVVFQNNFVSKKNNNENENSNISHCLRLFSNLERQASSNGL